MIPDIENYVNPQIGDFFMVRTVRFKRRNRTYLWPVVDHIHTDEGYGQPAPHYHIDWRFMSQFLVWEHRNNVDLIMWPEIEKEYFSPIMEDEVIGQLRMKWKYRRDHCFPETRGFRLLKELMVERNAKMKNFKCAHHGTNLVSCKPVDGIITCPQHGLKWNAKTGELV